LRCSGVLDECDVFTACTVSYSFFHCFLRCCGFFFWSCCCCCCFCCVVWSHESVSLFQFAGDFSSQFKAVKAYRQLVQAPDIDQTIATFFLRLSAKFVTRTPLPLQHDGGQDVRGREGGGSKRLNVTCYGPYIHAINSLETDIIYRDIFSI
jgi:hypothetical protein